MIIPLMIRINDASRKNGNWISDHFTAIREIRHMKGNGQLPKEEY